ncbi:MAG: hypothetical protein RJB60_2076 [Pseudomonadota bacterium]|jgi:hypothetical protein
MMTSAHLLPTVLFWVLALGLLALPLWPTLAEWRRPTDVAPVPMAPAPHGTARAQALEFEAWLQAEASQNLKAGSDRGDNRQTLQRGDHACRVLGEPEAWWRQQRGKAIHEGLMASGDMAVPDDAVCPWEVVSLGALKLGRRVQVAAALGADLTVGHDARVFQWARASQTLRVQTGAHLDGDCSAGQQLLLADEVSFGRLHAPTIKVASQGDDAMAEPRGRTEALPLWRPDQGEALDEAGQTWRYPGDLTIPPRVRVAVALIVEGDLHIAQGAVMEAAVKVKGRTTVDAGVRMKAALVSVGATAVGAACHLAGPVVCEAALALGRAVVVGSEQAMTTASAPQITLADAVTVHGSLWAHEAGRVLRA